MNNRFGGALTNGELVRCRSVRQSSYKKLSMMAFETERLQGFPTPVLPGSGYGVWSQLAHASTPNLNGWCEGLKI